MSNYHRWFKVWQRARQRRRLRRAVLRAAAHVHDQHPHWEEFLFDDHFLLGRGMPIIERHREHAAATDAFDLTLAWVEQWPLMSAASRKTHLQTLTPIAAGFLNNVQQEMAKARQFSFKHAVTRRDRRVQATTGPFQLDR
jgi:hypothetical protein